MTSNERVLWRVELQNDPCAKCTCIDHADSFSAGRSAGLREAVEKLKGMAITCDVNENRIKEVTAYNEAIYESIAALRALEVKP